MLTGFLLCGVMGSTYACKWYDSLCDEWRGYLCRGEGEGGCFLHVFFSSSAGALWPCCCIKSNETRTTRPAGMSNRVLKPPAFFFCTLREWGLLVIKVQIIKAVLCFTRCVVMAVNLADDSFETCPRLPFWVTMMGYKSFLLTQLFCLFKSVHIPNPGYISNCKGPQLFLCVCVCVVRHWLHVTFAAYWRKQKKVTMLWWRHMYW